MKFHRAGKSDLEIAVIADKAMKKIALLESEKCAVPDMLADAFGDMLGQLLAYGLDEKNAKIAYEIGLHTGRWVYLTDAVFDYEEDQKQGTYNPFLYAFSNTEEMNRFRNSSLKGIMAMEAVSIMRAVDLIDFHGRAMLRSCIENIIYDGMEDVISMAFGKEQTDVE